MEGISMFKKVKAILFIFAVTILFQNVVLTFAEESKDFGLLNALGIDLSQPNQNISRGDFAYLIVKFLGLEDAVIRDNNVSYFIDVPENHPQKAFIDFVVVQGIMKGDGNEYFHPDDKILYQEAIKVLSTMLGYHKAAESAGGYPYGYLVTLPKLVRGIKFDLTEPLNQKVLAQMLTNCLDIEFTDYGIETVGTVLSLRKISEGKGVVSVAGKSTLSGKSKLPSDKVVINDDIYNVGSSSANLYFGQMVKYYYKINDGQYELIYVSPLNDIKKLVISYDNIVSFENYTYSYRTQDTDKIQQASISIKSYVIYNGMAISPGFSDYIPAYGSVTLIDNDDNDVFDVVIIDSVTTGIVKNVVDNVIYFENTSYLDLTKADIYLLEDLNGAPVDIDFIKPKMVLLISQSQNKDYICVKICDKKEEGEIDSFERDNNGYIINIGNKKLKSSPQLYMPNPNLSAGDYIVCYMDSNGLIAYIDINTTYNNKFGYVTKAVYKNIGNKVEVKIFTQDGEFSVFTVNDKTKFNGNTITDMSMFGDQVINKLVLFSANKNIIQSIFTPRIYSDNLDEPIEDGLRFQSAAINALYKERAYTFNGQVVIKDDTIVFIIPDDITLDEKFEIKKCNFFKTDRRYTVEGYTTQKDNIASEVVIVRPGVEGFEIPSDVDFIVVNKVTKIFTADSEKVTYSISGFYNGDEVTYILDDESVMNTQVETGDVIRVRTNSKSYVDKIYVIYDYSNDAFMPYIDNAPNPSAAIFAASCFTKASFYDMKDSVALLSIKDPKEVTKRSELAIHCVDKFILYKYDKDAKKFRLANVEDIVTYKEDAENYSTAVFMTSYGAPKSMVIY